MAVEQPKNGAINGSFLVLNLGTNTLEFGNSFPHPMSSDSFRSIPIDKTPNSNTSNNADTLSTSPNSNTNDSADTLSTSSEEGSSESENHKTKRASKGKEDPDWVPKKRARRTNKSKQGPSISSTPSQISLLGGVNGMLNSGVGTPPQHLMGLLRCFGWRVVSRPEHDDCVYISPSGFAYCSLLKAFDTFLHGTSKYNEMAGVSTQVFMNSNTGDSSVQKIDPSESSLGLGSSSATDDSRKRGRGRKKKNANGFDKNEPVKPIEEPVCAKDDSVVDDGQRFSELQDSLVLQGANRVSSLCRIDEKTKSIVDNRRLSTESNLMACSSNLANSDAFRDGKARRSRRISGRHVPGENELCILSESRASRGNGKDKEEQIPASSQPEILMGERPENSEIDEGLDDEVRRLDCSNMTAKENDQRSRCSTQRDSKLVGLRRSGRLNKKNDVVDVELDQHNVVENSYLGKRKYGVGTYARKEKGRMVISEESFDEKTPRNMIGENMHGGAKRLECSSKALLSEPNISDSRGCSRSNGVRRSTRINGKHVPVDDDSDMEIESDDDFLVPSDFGVNIVAKKGRENLVTPSFKVDKMEGGSPASDDIRLKKNSKDSFDCQKVKKIVKSQKLKCGKSSYPLKETGMETPSFAAQRKTPGFGSSNGKKKKKRRGGCGLTARRKGKDDHQEEILSQTKVTILSWLIDCGLLTEDEKVFYISKNSMGKTSTGLVTGGRIWCSCCKEVVPLLKFVAHAGGNLQQPWDSIFLLSGKTLLMCLKEAWDKERRKGKIGCHTVGVGDPDPSDDTCGVCADGGHLLCCDSCPSTFHQNCLTLKALPEGSWNCPSCRCLFCMATLHGSGIHPETSTLLSCKQCGRKYHQKCAWGNEIHLMGSMPTYFCGKNCQKVETQLSDMLGATNPMEGGFSWTLLKHFDEDEGTISSQRLSFIMESNVKLSMALSVLNECFVPLIDQRTGVDMICQAVFNCGSNFNRLNYEGFYTLILEKDDEIISAATLRIHGTSLAEMPLIGTRPMYRRQGMCRCLLKAVEELLSLLHVEKLIIPAIPDLLETWTTSFSFKPLQSFHKDEIKNLNMMVFAETILLQKSICSTEILAQEDGMHADKDVSLEKNIQETSELTRACADQICPGGHSAGNPDWWSDGCHLNGLMDAAPEPCRISENIRFPSNSWSIPPPNFLSGSISEASPVQSAFATNPSLAAQSITAAPFSFLSMNVPLDNDPLGRTVTAPNDHMNMWFQSGDEAKDLQIDAISASLSFDNLLRMRS